MSPSTKSKSIGQTLFDDDRPPIRVVGKRRVVVQEKELFFTPNGVCFTMIDPETIAFGTQNEVLHACFNQGRVTRHPGFE